MGEQKEEENGTNLSTPNTNKNTPKTVKPSPKIHLVEQVNPTEREKTVKALSTAYEHEIINHEEYLARLDSALHTQKTYELKHLTSDLPEPYRTVEVVKKQNKPTRPPPQKFKDELVAILAVLIGGIIFLGIIVAGNQPSERARILWEKKKIPAVVVESANSIAALFTDASTQQGEPFTAPPGIQKDFAEFATPSGVPLPNTSQVISTQLIKTLEEESGSDWIIESQPDGGLILSTQWWGYEGLDFKCVIQPETQDSKTYSYRCGKSL